MVRQGSSGRGCPIGEQLLAEADRTSVPLAVLERDYVISWLVASIFSDPNLSDRLALRGSNAVRKGYLSQARYSADLDFKSVDLISPDRLEQGLSRACARTAERTSIEFLHPSIRDVLARRIGFSRYLYKYSCTATGPAGTSVELMIDVIQNDRTLLPLQQRMLLHPYSDAASCVRAIRCVKLEEILAEKLWCILLKRYLKRTTHDARDLVDWSLRHEGKSVSWLEAFVTFFRRMRYAIGEEARAANLDVRGAVLGARSGRPVL